MKKIILNQLKKPSGIIGRYVLPILWNIRNKALNNIALSSFDINNNDRILEIGIGGGYLLAKIIPRLKNGHYWGIDKSEEIINYCQNKYKKYIKSNLLTLSQMDLKDLKYNDNLFNKIYSINSIMYWNNIENIFQRLYRIADNNCSLILCFTSNESLKTSPFFNKTKQYHSLENIQNQIIKSGFKNATTQKYQDRFRYFYCITSQKIN